MCVYVRACVCVHVCEGCARARARAFVSTGVSLCAPCDRACTRQLPCVLVLQCVAVCRSVSHCVSVW